MTKSLLERLPLEGVHPVAKAAYVSLAIAVTFALRYWAQDHLPFLSPFTTFFSAIVVCGFLFGVRWAMLAFLGSAILSNYFFLPPTRTFMLNEQSSWLLGGFAFNAGVTLVIISWLQSLKDRLIVARETTTRLAETRELLFRELQHRVSNNLQTIAALLNIQRKQVSDPHAQAALDEAARRVGVVGRISRQLYDPQGSGQDLALFLDQLAREVIEASGRSDVAHDVQASQIMAVAPDDAIPLALVVAESIANAIEHGFADGQTDCAITIRLDRPSESAIRVEVEDNGRGLPPGFTLEKSDSIGLRIASMLAGQLGGNFTLAPASKGGALARLELAQVA